MESPRTTAQDIDNSNLAQVSLRFRQLMDTLSQLDRNINDVSQFTEEWSKGYEECMDLIEISKHNSIMLNTLLDDLLDLAKHEQLTFQLNKAYFNLFDAINYSFMNLGFIAGKKQVALRVNVDQSERCIFECIYGDQKRYE